MRTILLSKEQNAEQLPGIPPFPFPHSPLRLFIQSVPSRIYLKYFLIQRKNNAFLSLLKNIQLFISSLFLLSCICYLYNAL